MSDAALRTELRDLISEIAEIDDFPDTKDFKDLGIDSMMGVEIVAAIERQYQIKIADTELQEVTTLAGSYDLVRRKLEAKTELLASA